MARSITEITETKTYKIEVATCDRCGWVVRNNKRRYGLAPIETCEVCNRDVCSRCRKIEWFNQLDDDDMHVICVDCYEQGHEFLKEIRDLVDWRDNEIDKIHEEYERCVKEVLKRWYKHISAEVKDEEQETKQQ